MAAQYSNRHFFRKTPNHFLTLFFEAKGIPLEVELKENDADALQTALNTLTDSQTSEIEAEFQDVNALACEGGIMALVDEAGFHGDDAFVEEIAAIEGFHATAICGYFFQKEGRGKNCTVEPYRRNQKEYFFAYPEDFAQSAVEWVGDTLKSQAHTPDLTIARNQQDYLEPIGML